MLRNSTMPRLFQHLSGITLFVHELLYRETAPCIGRRFASGSLSRPGASQSFNPSSGAAPS